MNDESGLGQYLLQGQNRGDYADMDENRDPLSANKDDEDLVVAQLIQELNNIKEVSLIVS